MAYDEQLAERVRALLSDAPDYDEKKMFGGIGFLIRGNMACGVKGDGLMLRVGKEAYEATLQEPDVSIFGKPERPMTGWVLVRPEGLAEDEDLAGWVERGREQAMALPPK